MERCYLSEARDERWGPVNPQQIFNCSSIKYSDADYLEDYLRNYRSRFFPGLLITLKKDVLLIPLKLAIKASKALMVFYQIHHARG